MLEFAGTFICALKVPYGFMSGQAGVPTSNGDLAGPIIAYDSLDLQTFLAVDWGDFPPL